jgi:hypothetical protein
MTLNDVSLDAVHTRIVRNILIRISNSGNTPRRSLEFMHLQCALELRLGLTLDVGSQLSTNGAGIRSINSESEGARTRKCVFLLARSSRPWIMDAIFSYPEITVTRENLP